MVRAIIGYSELVFNTDGDKFFKCKPIDSNLILDPEYIGKSIKIKVEVEDEFQKFQDYFLDGLIREIKEIIIVAVDQTNLAHLFVFSKPQIVFIKGDSFSFNYEYADLSVVGAAKPVYRKIKTLPKPIFIDPSKPLPVTEATEFLEFRLNKQGLPERITKKSTPAPWTPATNCTELAIKIVWDEITCEQIEKELESKYRDIYWYDCFINDLDKEIKRFKVKNKKTKLKNSILKFFRVSWSLLTLPIGK